VGLNSWFETVHGPQNVPFPDVVDPRAFVADSGSGRYLAYLRAAVRDDAPLRSLANGVSIKLLYDYPKLLPDLLRPNPSGDHYVDASLDWHADRDGPWAACLNLMDAHIPYEPSEKYDDWGGRQLRTLQDSISEQKWAFAGGQEPWWKREALESLYDRSTRPSNGWLPRSTGAERSTRRSSSSQRTTAKGSASTATYGWGSESPNTSPHPRVPAARPARGPTAGRLRGASTRRPRLAHCVPDGSRAAAKRRRPVVPH